MATRFESGVIDLIILGALVRRIATISGSGILAAVIGGWPEWTKQGFEADPQTAALWPIFWLIAEAVQKYWRERKKAR